MGGNKIDLAGKGFRGGAGRQLGGVGGLLLTDYRTANTSAANGSKGEGIAGTPRYVNAGGSTIAPTDLGTTVGYPDGTTVGGGDNGRGAPGNAGGGGTDTNPNANDENTGGGGGSNGGTGGQGGNGWQSNLPYGGFGAAPFLLASPSRLVMGGGGGAGTTNNGTVDDGVAANNNVGGVAGNNITGNGFASSGAAGGGIALVRASNVSGTGTIDVSGADMNYVALNDGSGGGGAGGSVLLVSNNTTAGALTGITVTANGGKGGSNNPGGSGPHGPGGGGAGGVAFTSSPVNAASSYQAGVNGLTEGSITYEASPGTSSSTSVRTNIGFDETPLVQSGANCVNDLTTTLSGPTTLAIGASSGPFTVTFTNNGLGSVGNYLTRSITLPTGASLSAAQTTYLNSTYGLTGNGLNTGSYSTTGAGATAVTTINFGAVANQVYNASASYTFFFTAPAAVGTPSLGSALTVDPTFGNTYYTNQGANVAPDAATLALNVVNTLVTGTVYEDVNYGGGLGRNYATSNTSATTAPSTFTSGAIRRPGVRVELYSTSTGAYVTSTITDANGLYTFPVTATTGYTVRVVNSSVTSVRAGATSTGSAASGFVSNQVAVQTYNGSTDRVGGEYPALTDAPANTTSANLSTLTSGSLAAESIATITSGANNSTTTGPDFGFNFDVVANTNASGQGSLAQFVANANALGNESILNQSGSRKDAANATQTLPAGKETSIFMISDGSAHNGLRLYNAGTNPGLISQFTGGVAVITTTTPLSLSGTLTVLDGTTQTANVGDTNTGTATNATATTVGVGNVTTARHTEAGSRNQRFGRGLRYWMWKRPTPLCGA